MGYSLDPFREKVRCAEIAGKSRKEIASCCGMAYQTLSNIMAGRDSMKISIALKCAKYFECDLNGIMGDDENG